MSHHGPLKTRTGQVLQGALPKIRGPVRQPGLQMTQGELIRGVVTATYVYDEGEGIPSRQGNDEQLAVYADVIAYTSIVGSRYNFFPRCLVSQERSGLHDGDIWIPRATTLDTSGGALNIQNPIESDPMDWDGDHVLVGFMDGYYNLPVVLRSIPHPNADKGKPGNAALGTRLRIRQADGEPRLIKHHGTVFGVDAAGNFTVDTRNANNGAYSPTGEEAAAPQDGSAGNVTIRAQPGASITAEGDETNLSTTRVRLGASASEAVVLGTTWTASRAQLNAALQAGLTAIGVAATAFGAGVATQPLTKADAAAFATAVNTAIVAMNQAIASFETGDYLSDNVTTRS